MERAALGKRIRESRITKGYTQQDLAVKADIGTVYLSEIERGVKMLHTAVSSGSWCGGQRQQCGDSGSGLR